VFGPWNGVLKSYDDGDDGNHHPNVEEEEEEYCVSIFFKVQAPKSPRVLETKKRFLEKFSKAHQ